MNERLLTTTETIDPVFMFIFGVCLVLLLGITAAMALFVFRYHRSRSPEPTSQASGNLWLELIWTLLPTLLVLAMFYYGWVGYRTLRSVPKGALAVTANARMWSWSFTYENGKTSSRLYVPVGKPVKVALVSSDVLHAFYIPAFRVKRDVVPGMENYVWFVAPKSGSYDIFCSQYCGVGHSAMITTLEALPVPDFDEWLKQSERKPRDSAKGILERYGCLGCHSLDGTSKVGPTFRGIWGRRVTVVSGGVERTIIADEMYLRRAIREPLADIVKGFPPVMPTLPLKEEELAAVIELFKGVK